MKDFNTQNLSPQKQHLGISPYADHILEEDRFIYSPTEKLLPKNRFFNQLFKNYLEMEIYPANLSAMYYNMNLDFELELLQIPRLSAKQETKLLQAYADTFLKRYRAELQPSAETKKYTTFTLDQANVMALADLDGSAEAEVFGKPGKFLSAIIETYARKPFVEREKIFCHEVVENLEMAIMNGGLARISHTNGNVYYVVPHIIDADTLGSYLYLAGKVIDTNDPEWKDKPNPYYASFRIDRIVNVHTLGATVEEQLTFAEKEELNQLILEKGIQYILVPIISATVKFSERGLYLYHRMLHRRPSYVEKISDDTYRFEAPYTQLKYYFAGLAGFAEVLEPADLRDSLHELFQTATQVYSKVE